MLRNVFIRSAVLLLVLGQGNGRAAGGDTVQILIEGGQLSKPIGIAERAVTARFRVGTGPGTFELLQDGTHLTNMSPSFVINWGGGVASVPKGLPRYQASFVTGRRDGGVYVVTYAFDPSTQLGYLYIPGVQDRQYASNTRLIVRGIEGNWFHAWSAWEHVANSLIAQALGSH
ncbi:MAG: hypothetical protein WBY44_22900 [Bryobacteraceae bacterium]|jgi:hypothetical protein